MWIGGDECYGFDRVLLVAAAVEAVEGVSEQFLSSGFVCRAVQYSILIMEYDQIAEHNAG